MTRTALVTGATGGIGRAICRALALDGCQLVIHTNKNISAAHRLAAEILAFSSAHSAVIPADLRDEAQIAALFTQAEERFGGVDILVNNAGIALPPQLVTDTSTDAFDDLFSIDVRGVFLCARAAVSHMVRQKYGRIVNISSMWGITGASCEVAYSAAKAAVIGLTKSLASELALSQITVNCVAPGVIDTPMNMHLSPEDIAELQARTPIGRIGTPEDIAHAVCFFASEASGFITGQTLLCDGLFS
ncbi:MAG: SDR family oxidoreductase [Oscillospiraceae bacterium]|jgi:3-oxoacyl-[acyl-carrier protein] reductase|nr:SDR family oxidoreductase [Oscillospiraceae bacterium]